MAAMVHLLQKETPVVPRGIDTRLINFVWSGRCFVGVLSKGWTRKGCLRFRGKIARCVTAHGCSLCASEHHILNSPNAMAVTEKIDGHWSAKTCVHTRLSWQRASRQEVACWYFFTHRLHRPFCFGAMKWQINLTCLPNKLLTFLIKVGTKILAC